MERKEFLHYYCPVCNNNFKVDVTDLSKVYKKMFKDCIIGRAVHMPEPWWVICPYCTDYQSTFEIDKDIIKHIKFLNTKKNLTTVASCSGHDKNDLFHTATRDIYIAIEWVEKFNLFDFDYLYNKYEKKFNFEMKNVYGFNSLIIRNTDEVTPLKELRKILMEIIKEL